MLTNYQKNRLNGIISDITNDFRNDVNNDILNGNGALLEDKTRQYIAILAPFYFSLYAGAINAQPSFTHQQQIKLEIEEELNKIVQHLYEVRRDASKKIDDLDINTKDYLNATSDDITENIKASNKNNVMNLAILSPLLLGDSILNRVSCTEAKAEYTQAINTLNYQNEPLFNAKEWRWSMLEKTRHSGMEGTIVPINEMFMIYNEVSGQIDYGRFPRDYDNVLPRNAYNCGCECIYFYNPDF